MLFIMSAFETVWRVSWHNIMKYRIRWIGNSMSEIKFTSQSIFGLRLQLVAQHYHWCYRNASCLRSSWAPSWTTMTICLKTGHGHSEVCTFNVTLKLFLVPVTLTLSSGTVNIWSIFLVTLKLSADYIESSIVSTLLWILQ